MATKFGVFIDLQVSDDSLCFVREISLMFLSCYCKLFL